MTSDNHDNEISRLAAALGRLGRGKPKHYSAQEIETRRQRMVAINARKAAAKAAKEGQ